MTRFDIAFRIEDKQEPDRAPISDFATNGSLRARFDAEMGALSSLKAGGKEYLAGMFGGAGQAAVSDEHLIRDGLPFSLREDYVRSVERIIDEPVELHIGNHPSNNNHNDKAARMTEDYNPFIEEKTWVPFLEECRDGVAQRYGIKLAK